jgi:hypothetical protein
MTVKTHNMKKFENLCRHIEKLKLPARFPEQVINGDQGRHPDRIDHFDTTEINFHAPRPFPYPRHNIASKLLGAAGDKVSFKRDDHRRFAACCFFY